MLVLRILLSDSCLKGLIGLIVQRCVLKCSVESVIHQAEQLSDHAGVAM